MFLQIIASMSVASAACVATSDCSTGESCYLVRHGKDMADTVYSVIEDVADWESMALNNTYANPANAKCIATASFTEIADASCDDTTYCTTDLFCQHAKDQAGVCKAFVVDNCTTSGLCGPDQLCGAVDSFGIFEDMITNVTSSASCLNAAASTETCGATDACFDGTELYCKSGKCASYPNAGENCIDGQYCASPNSCVADFCQSASDLGLPCSADGACVEGDCMKADASGIYTAASNATGFCVKVTTAHGVCDSMHYCPSTSFCGNGKCQSRGEKDTPCKEDKTCSRGLTCTDGTCYDDKSEGAYSAMAVGSAFLMAALF